MFNLALIQRHRGPQRLLGFHVAVAPSGTALRSKPHRSLQSCSGTKALDAIPEPNKALSAKIPLTLITMLSFSTEYILYFTRVLFFIVSYFMLSRSYIYVTASVFQFLLVCCFVKYKSFKLIPVTPASLILTEKHQTCILCDRIDCILKMDL